MNDAWETGTLTNTFKVNFDLLWRIIVCYVFRRDIAFKFTWSEKGSLKSNCLYIAGFGANISIVKRS